MVLGVASHAQNLDSLMQAESKPEKTLITATFKGTKIVNGHSVESPSKGVLQLMFLHRFGPLNEPLYDFLGMDQATIRIGLDYGITKNLAVGVGRSTLQKAYDFYAKYRILTQSKGYRAVPVTVSIVAATAVNTEKKQFDPLLTYSETGLHRLYYTAQLLVARKFGESLSIQIMPTAIHRNLVDNLDQSNTIYSLGVGGRVKLTKRFALTGEYYFTPENQLGKGFYNPLALGFDIETGGHVFQIHVTNTSGMIEHHFIGATNTDFFDGSTSVRLGFNFSRVFTIVRSDKGKNAW